MDYLKQITSLQQDCTYKLQFTKIGLSQLKKQAKRILSLLSKYQNIKKLQVIALKNTISAYNFAEIEQYGELAAKQFYDALKPLNDKLLKYKMQISTLSKQIKAKPTEDYKLRLDKVKGVLGQFQSEWLSVWKEQHFLMLNYRMDICAKEIQRWTIIMNNNKLNEQITKQKVNSLFS